MEVKKRSIFYSLGNTPPLAGVAKPVSTFAIEPGRTVPGDELENSGIHVTVYTVFLLFAGPDVELGVSYTDN